MRRHPSTCVALLASIAVLLAGCSSGDRTYDLSGSVTYQGKPVPAGQIVFEPQGDAGNNGGPGFAKIKDGHYDTRILEGRGTLGGPHSVTIHGLDGVVRGELLNGIPLCPDYRTTADLPKKDAQQDFDVPASSARK